MNSTPILKYFDSNSADEISYHFAELARWVDSNLDNGPEKSTALRKLLEGMDAAIRAGMK